MVTARVRRAVKYHGQRLRGAVMRPWQGGRWSLADDAVAAVPFAYDLSAVTAPARGIAVVCHLFYAELAADIRGVLANIPFDADVYLSTDTEAKRAAIEAIFTDWSAGRVEVRISINRGRDVAPKFVTFADVYARYELVLFLHGKKTVTSDNGSGAEWRDLLYRTLVGSPDTVRSIIALFACDPKLGIIAPQHFAAIRGFIHWDENFGHARRFAGRMGLTLVAPARHRLRRGLHVLGARRGAASAGRREAVL